MLTKDHTRQTKTSRARSILLGCPAVKLGPPDKELRKDELTRKDGIGALWLLLSASEEIHCEAYTSI